MVTNAFEESGLEELKRLSREIGDKGKELATGLGRARRSYEQVKKKQALWSIIRDYKISMVLEKLEPLADFNVLNQVSALKYKQSPAALNKTVLNMVDELDKNFSVDDISAVDVAETKKKLKILSILLELLFYIQ